ncbi:hypothetical protein MPER_03056 [Moniliophthora perniciosa FA553]|nr:hypothetical protein MPER_03056 [Moniliophthora perniciosa FA553]
MLFIVALAALAPFASTAPPPFTPSGGIGLNVTPVYAPMSDFDFQSINSRRA